MAILPDKKTLKDKLINGLAKLIPFSVFSGYIPIKFSMYGHLISNYPHPVSTYYRFPNLQEFESLIDRFRGLGYEFVTLQNYLKDDGRKKILLTFDDGFKVIYDETNKYLQEKGIPYMIFVLTDPLDDPGFYIKTIKPDPVSFAGTRLFMSAAEIAELKGQGVHIGFHTRSHYRIEEPDDPNDKALSDQISIPDKYTSLFSNPLCFAYPYLAPSNFHQFNLLMQNRFDYKYFFDTKGFRAGASEHFFRVSIDAEHNVDSKEWLTFVIKRQLLLYLIRKLRKNGIF